MKVELLKQFSIFLPNRPGALARLAKLFADKGVNMLGIGLHSYGFMGAAGASLLMFVIVMVMLVAIGNLPLSAWKSFGEEKDTAD